MKMHNIDHVTVVYKDGHSEVFYGHQIKGQKVDTEETGGRAGGTPPVNYLNLTLTPRKEHDAPEASAAK